MAVEIDVAIINAHVEAWKIARGTIQNFDDLGLAIRSGGLAVLAATAVSQKYEKRRVRAAAALAGLSFWTLLGALDLMWLVPMQTAAAHYAQHLEQELWGHGLSIAIMQRPPTLGMWRSYEAVTVLWVAGGGVAAAAVSAVLWGWDIAIARRFAAFLSDQDPLPESDRQPRRRVALD